MTRIGLLIPSSNTVMERDLHQALGAAAGIHTARMLLTEVTPDAEQRMLEEEVGPAARRIATVEPDIVVFGCTSAEALHGADYSRQLHDELASLTGATRVVSVLGSVTAALAGYRAVALLTPYPPELTERIAVRLTAAGIPITQRHSLGIRANTAIGRLSPDYITAAADELDPTDADALFCSCTNLRAVEARTRIAEATGLPVITSNQAVIDRVRDLLPVDAQAR